MSAQIIKISNQVTTTKDSKMFTRHLTMKLKANSAAALTSVFQSEITALLRKEKGFRDCIIFIDAKSSEAISDSLWETKEDAEAYSRTEYPDVLKLLSNFVEGIPRVESFKITSSMFQKMADHAARSTQTFLISR